ncbi:tetratricopeptide repeat protein [Curtobacterium flaccumfaciens]|uniref:tetratricopeptide repeat protein n=1 Tax=Curtobacterium flaccumfaciens TaxID=2035 RepID=UPI001BDF5219|nr:tetratricopeptide repeat protein [Curtobacterium flaccumfaciens]MBT1607470.1 tetratricopeptide repeat protein [Curtobacterium flaccumfaciens pv. betae]MBT1657252.1 tetratricopeptide repeat protein [Curtobacterium flaccumfaciens pv. betae]MCS0472435.1 tetratricopeptide repeat protein [Curtobacterium flaccumfaciens pv. betae]MCS0474658.1 tetratricopeptide repeat protein [Curtobacterium flaccumfaciens pv. betae]MCS0479175.1 tetratricopeptide repeat protein [Curtobacterium flaccumfaciens pv. be
MSNIPPTPSGLRGAVDLSSLVDRAQRPPQPSGAPAPAGSPGGAVPGTEAGTVNGADLTVPSLVIDVTDATFQDVLQLSTVVPVIVDIWAEWCGPCKQLSPILEQLTAEYDGRVVLAKVDADTNPQLVQAFQAQSIPTVAAVIGGRPLGLFVGALPEAQVRDVYEQVLQAAEQNGVTGRVTVDGAAAPSDAEQGEPEPEPLPPHHQAAYDAIERGDYATAVEEYKTAILQDPHDQMAVAGLAQVSLLDRLNGRTADEIRAAAAAGPQDVQAQLAVADLDVSGGHVDDAFGRLLDLVPTVFGDDREALRVRLVEYFELIGSEDPRVVAARRRLANALY